MWGLNVEQVKNFATQLDQKAGEIDKIQSTLTSTLQSTEWTGPDAQRFRTDWDGKYSKALRLVSDALKETAQQSRKHAQEQEAASK